MGQEQLKVEEEPDSVISMCAFSETGNFMALGTTTGFVKIWKCRDSKLDLDFNPNSVWITKPTSDEIAAVASSTSLSSTDLQLTEGVTALTFGNRVDGEFLGAGTSRGRIFMWHVHTNEVKKISFLTKETHFTAVLSEHVRTYVDDSEQSIKSLSFIPDSLGFVSSTAEITKVPQSFLGSLFERINSLTTTTTTTKFGSFGIFPRKNQKMPPHCSTRSSWPRLR